MREFELLKHIYSVSRFPGDRVRIGPGDDMGMIRLDGRDLLAAVDQLIDGRHVRLQTTPIELVGRKAMARSLSDIAAMAAKPVASLVSATLSRDFDAARANALFDAMRVIASEFDCPIIGGDIAFHREPSFPMVCSVTVLAEPAGFPPVQRNGARAGDTVYVTGKLGGSLQADGLGHHLTFTPRVWEALELGELLGRRLHAMLDLSDGLGRDVSHIAELSGIRIEIEAAKIPCNQGCDWLRAVSDGEDYELCFTASGLVPASIRGIPVTAIGRVLERTERDPMVAIRHPGGIVDASGMGWEHSA